MTEQSRPTLLASCAKAATAAEARFRVQYPNALDRTSRIFALDEGAAEAMRSIADEAWQGAHFLTVAAPGDAGSGETAAADLRVRRPDGSLTLLSDEIAGADLVVLLSSNGTNGSAAEAIARAANDRRIMTAGLALADGLSKSAADKVVNAMRPFASVLVVASGNDFIPAMLTALRA